MSSGAARIGEPPAARSVCYGSKGQQAMASVEKRFTGENRFTVYVGNIVVARSLSSMAADALVMELRSRLEAGA